MSNKKPTYEELENKVSELEAKLEEWDILSKKESYDQTNNSKEVLLPDNNAFIKLNQVALELSNLSTNDNIEEIISKRFIEIANAEIALFAEYNAENKTLTPRHLEMESGVFKKIVKIIGRNPFDIHSVITDEIYNEIVREKIGVRKTLYDALLGAIPRHIANSIQSLFRFDHFIGIAYILDGELYGTGVLAMRKGHSGPPKEIAENLVYLASAALRRKQFEKVLKESEKKFRLYIENAPLGVFVVDQKGKYIEVNPEASKLLGYSRDELLKLSISDVSLLDDGGNNFKKLKKSQLSNFESKLRQKDGSIISVSMRANALYNGHFIAFCLDITERKNAEKALKESQVSLLDAQRIANIGNWFLDLNTNIVEISDEMRNVIGLKTDSGVLYLSDFEGVCTDESWKEIKRGMKTVIQTRDRYKIEIEFSEQNINFRYAVIRGEPVFDDDNKLYAIKGTLQDITEIKNKEAELKKLNDDKDKFISILAHDLKNPFNSILGFSDFLSKNIRNFDIDKIENYINVINNTANTTYQLLENILSWSRAESGKIGFHPSVFNFNEACMSIIEDVNIQAVSKEINIRCNVSKEFAVFTDINLVETVLRNLISNAIKFTNKQGVININANKIGDDIVVSVVDNGVGMENDTLSNLFKGVKYNTKKGTNMEDGTGLGLNICKEFVEIMGGRIWAESEVGKGSIFYFSIPKNKKKLGL